MWNLIGDDLGKEGICGCDKKMFHFKLRNATLDDRREENGNFCGGKTYLISSPFC